MIMIQYALGYTRTFLGDAHILSFNDKKIKSRRGSRSHSNASLNDTKNDTSNASLTNDTSNAAPNDTSNDNVHCVCPK